MREEDYKKKLAEYLRKNISKGYTIDSLKWALINQGYSRTIVTRAINEFNKTLAEKAPILKEKPVIKYEVYDENNKPINFKKNWWKRIFGK
ncbi:MAG: hypothetical protein PVJ67_01035 [Candidatus Pacearchaeota archaeon]|jgi:hypothetical protein